MMRQACFGALTLYFQIPVLSYNPHMQNPFHQYPYPHPSCFYVHSKTQNIITYIINVSIDSPAEAFHLLTTSDGLPVLDTEGEPIVLEDDDIVSSKIVVGKDGTLYYPDDENVPQSMDINWFLFHIGGCRFCLYCLI